MKVILQKAVPKLGKAGDVVTVSDGYAANALFPRNLAILATEKNLAQLKRKQDAVIHQKELQHDLLERALSGLSDETLVLRMRANDKGHLFSKVTEADIVRALLAERISISEKHVFIKDQIKAVGEYEVLLHEGSLRRQIRVRIDPL